MLNVNSNLKSSASALMKEYHAITHNIANAGTSGFKRRASSFSEKLSEQTGKAATGAKGGIEFKSEIDFSQGSFEQTQRPLDFAINGEAFFVIETPEDTKYTRNGQLNLSSSRQLVDCHGRAIAGANGPITVPRGVSENQISVSPEGDVMAAGANVGKIRMVEFGDAIGRLTPVGENCFVAPDDVLPVAANKSMVEQGYRESSNVDSVRETINLITVSRMYEASMKVMTKRAESTKSILNVAMG
jgi:flagellar basal-body rod protein FlgF